MYQVQIEISEDEQHTLSDYYLEKGALSVTINLSSGKIFITILANTMGWFKQVGIKQKPYRLKKSDWEYKYEYSVSGFELTPKVYVQSAHSPLPLTGKKHPIIITLDLRGAFGTGNHPTTQLCAEVLTLLLTKHAIQSVCDIGTGTGILSILAAKLGIKTIHGFDIDPLSVKRAKANNRINSTGCKFWKNNILKDTTQKKYDLIVANLQTEILSEALNQITALISPQGWLILSGISSQWQEEMAKKIKALNPISLDIKEKDGWCAFWAQLT